MTTSKRKYIKLEKNDWKQTGEFINVRNPLKKIIKSVIDAKTGILA